MIPPLENQKSNSPGPIWALTFIRSNTEYPLDSVNHWLALKAIIYPHRAQFSCYCVLHSTLVEDNLFIIIGSTDVVTNNFFLPHVLLKNCC